MVQLQYVLSTRAERSHSDFSQECARGGLMVVYSRRLSPHSIRDLLESWATSSFHVVLNTELMLESQQSLGPPHIFWLCINWHDLPGECYQMCTQHMIKSWWAVMPRLCWRNSINLPLCDSWVSDVSSVNGLFCRAPLYNFFITTFPLTVMVTQPV